MKRLNFPFLPGAPANRIKVLDDMHKWYFGHHSTVDTIAESPVSLPVAEPVAPAEPQAVIEIQDTTETAANPETPEEPSSTHEAADSPKATWGFLKDFKLPSWNLGLQTTSHGRPSHVPSFMFLLGGKERKAFDIPPLIELRRRVTGRDPTSSQEPRSRRFQQVPGILRLSFATKDL